MIGVCIVTYNQEKYIAHAIDSVLEQEPCGQDVVVYIGEDCSTDRTRSICEEYACKYPSKVVVLSNESNLGLVGNTLSVMERMKEDECDYIAMLDGDDYWSDPKKLQKQMSVFDRYPDVGLVHTAVDVLYPSGLVRDKRNAFQCGNAFSVIENYRIGNCSVVFKSSLLEMIDFDEFRKQGFKSLDYVMYACFASKVPFAFLPDHTAVWRRDHVSVSNTQSMEHQIAYIKNDLAMWKYLSSRFPERWSYDEGGVNDYYHTQAFQIAFRYGDRKRAVEEAKQIKHASKKLKLKMLASHSVIFTSLVRLFQKIQMSSEASQ